MSLLLKSKAWTLFLPFFFVILVRHYDIFHLIFIHLTCSSIIKLVLV
jgi:hypothetical protein